MSVLPPSPFVSESAAPPAVDDPAAAPLPAGVAAGDLFPSSPAPLQGSLNSGESDPSVTLDCGAGETFRVPRGYVLLERAVLESLIHRIADYASRADDLAVHSFLANPDFSRAMERGAA